MTLYHISIKKIIKHCTFSILAGTLILSYAVLYGCSSKVNTTQTADSESQEPISTTAIKLNTAVTITIYDSQNKNLLTECMNLCDKYEKIFSRTASDSELYKLNHRQQYQNTGKDQKRNGGSHRRYGHESRYEGSDDASHGIKCP